MARRLVGVAVVENKLDLDILPIDDFVSASCNNNHAFHFSLTQNRRTAWFDRISLERCYLLVITPCQVLLDDLLQSFDSRRLPSHATFSRSSALSRIVDRAVAYTPAEGSNFDNL
jgi:hypothetical protein